MLETILYYASMWSPAIVAIAGVLATVILAIGKVKKAIDSWCETNTEEKSTLDTLKADIKTSVAQNQRLQAYNQKLLEELTRIKGYDIDLEEPGDESK